MCTKAEYWCVDCSEYLCSACSKTHTRFAMSRDHKIVSACEAEELSVSFDMKGLDQCKEHSKMLEFVCEDDDMLCCSICAIAKHRKCHNVVEIKNKAKSGTTDLESLRQDLLNIESNIKAFAQRLMNIRGKVTTDANEITNKIQEMQDKFHEMFEHLKKNVAKDMHSFKNQAFQDLDMKNDVCNSNITDVTEALSDVDDVKLQGTPPQQLIMAHRLKDPLYTGMEFLPDGRLVAVDNKNKKCLVYNQKLEKVGSAIFPRIVHDVTVMTDEDVAVSSGTEIYLIKISNSSEVTMTRTLKMTINCYSICMIKDNNFLVGCLNEPKPVRVVSVEGEERTLAIIFPSKQYKPDESACRYIKNRDKIVFSDRFAHTVYIYDTATNTRVEVKDEKIIKEPRGVAVGPGDCIFVCSENTHSIVQVSHTGHMLSSHVLEMKYPRSVCVSKDNSRLAVSNCATGKEKLQLFNIELIQ